MEHRILTLGLTYMTITDMDVIRDRENKRLQGRLGYHFRRLDMWLHNTGIYYDAALVFALIRWPFKEPKRMSMATALIPVGLAVQHFA